MHIIKAITGLGILLCLHTAAQIKQPVTGTITGSDGVVLEGAIVSVKNSGVRTRTNSKGIFSIDAAANGVLLVTMTGYIPLEINIEGKDTLSITLQARINELDETIVIAYGTTTRRLNTGSVGKLGSKDIATQAVGDPLTALSGRMTGVTVTQTSGVPGSTVKLQVRGRNSIAQGSEPLYIIDGVPVAAQNQAISRINSMISTELGTGISPFNSLSPSDIESIEVLKDAGATAIYGSRGANGVVLITTKKGKAGKTQVNANVYHAWSTVTRTMDMLNTEDYIQLRKEAFANDGVTPSATNAPDLVVWDNGRYTAMKKYLTGGTAQSTDAQLSIGGGNGTTRFLVSGSYRKEGTVYPGDMDMQRGSANLQLDHTSTDRKLFVSAGINTSFNTTNASSGDLAAFINLPPNFPSFFEADGTLKWQEGGVAFSNPMGYLYRDYTAKTDNLIARGILGYELYPGLIIKTNLGYNSMRNDEQSAIPIASQDPSGAPLGSLEVAANHYKGWIAEPQLELNCKINGGLINVLTGATFQQNINDGMNVQGNGYTSDNLIYSLSAAPAISRKRNSFTKYRYEAVFARINYNYKNRYIANLSGRNDGSSRFGPGKRWASFGALGAAWIFSHESFAQHTLPWISFGKLRGSFGTSGNDQIGDYAYLDNWTSGLVYQGAATLYPQNLYNPGYRWEVNRKLEAALDLGMFKDKIYMSLAWYRNRSGNQLVNYRLPTQTGFTGITENMDALVQNTGVEIELTTKNYTGKFFEWTSFFNLTLPKNKLLAFPNLESSSYATTYVVGEPLNLIYAYHYTGVDPATGVFQFEDINKDGTLSVLNDLAAGGTTDAAYYGGLQNVLRYKQFRADIFIEFRKQQGKNYLYSLYSGAGTPGRMYNMPVEILQRWQKPGDASDIQRLTTSTSNAAYVAGNNLLQSDGIYSDASFARMKTVSLSYSFPAAVLRKLKARQANIYLQCQNLFTITGYKGSDPETQRLFTLPPLRTVSAGIDIGF